MEKLLSERRGQPFLFHMRITERAVPLFHSTSDAVHVADGGRIQEADLRELRDVRDLDLYGRLLTLSGTSNLVHKIIQMIRQQVTLTYKDEAPVEPKTLDMAVYFLLSGLLAVFTEWYNSGRTQPIEKISEQLSLLCIDGMNGIMRAAQAGSIS